MGAACPELARSNPGLQKLMMGAFGLPLGLLMTLVTGGELVTGNFVLGTIAVREKKATLSQLMKSWGVSYLGNLVGSLLLASMVYHSRALSPISSASAVAIATAKTSAPFAATFLKATLCSYLVGIAVYMASGASSLASKAVAVWFPISAFVALGLEHCVANMFLVPLGMAFGAEVSVGTFLLKNLLPVTLGNAFGGAGMVALAFGGAYGRKD